MRAYDRSIDPHDSGSHNLLGLLWTGMGTAAVVIGMTLDGLLVLGTLLMLSDGLRLRDGGGR